MADRDSKPATKNNDVDYVIVFRFATGDRTKAEAQFSKLLKVLAENGLSLSVRDGGESSLLVFVKSVSEQSLFSEVYRSR
jgi:anoctamin-10